jgi:hypothetical protein
MYCRHEEKVTKMRLSAKSTLYYTTNNLPRGEFISYTCIKIPYEFLLCVINFANWNSPVQMQHLCGFTNDPQGQLNVLNKKSY